MSVGSSASCLNPAGTDMRPGHVLFYAFAGLHAENGGAANLNSDVPCGSCDAQEVLCIGFGFTRLEDGRAGNEHVRSCLDDAGDRVVSDAAVDFDTKVEAEF